MSEPTPRVTPPSSPAPRAPSRELDAEIAERVMGLTLANEARTFVEVPGSVEEVDGGEFVEVAFLPYYSTDIAAAWQVVEKLRDSGAPRHVGPVLLHMLRSCAGGDWEVQFCSDFGYTPATRAVTAPLAICLAALAAVAPPRAPLEGE